MLFGQDGNLEQDLLNSIKKSIEDRIASACET